MNDPKQKLEEVMIQLRKERREKDIETLRKTLPKEYQEEDQKEQPNQSG
jgi:hypothetical protein